MKYAERAAEKINELVLLSPYSRGGNNCEEISATRRRVKNGQ